MNSVNEPGTSTLLRMWKLKFRSRFRQPCNRPAIALVVNGMEKGGVEQVILDLYHGYKRKGYRSYIICQNWVIESVKDKLEAPEDLFVFEGNLFSLIQFLWRRDIRNLHFHYNVFGIEELKTLGFRIVYTMHNTYTWMSDAEIKKYAERLSHADCVVAVSEAAKDYFLRRTQHSEIRFHVIHNGIDFAELDQKEKLLPYTREDLGIQTDDIVISFVGSFYHQKNQIGMLGVMEKLIAIYPQAKLVFLGNVGNENYYHRFLQELSDSSARSNIILAPPLDHMLMGQFYRDITDIFALPALYEGGPLVAVEAMYCGVPIVLTPVGIADRLSSVAACLICDAAYNDLTVITDEEVKNSLSLKKHPDNEDSIVDCLSKMIAELPDYRKKASECIANAKEFSIDRMIDSYVNLFEL